MCMPRSPLEEGQQGSPENLNDEGAESVGPERDESPRPRRSHSRHKVQMLNAGPAPEVPAFVDVGLH